MILKSEAINIYKLINLKNNSNSKNIALNINSKKDRR